MMHIVPSILEFSLQTFREKLAEIKKLGPRIQIDIGDGMFTPEKTLQLADIALENFSGMETEIHLMVRDVQTFVDAWIPHTPSRILVHAESKPSAQCIQEIASCGTTPVIALNYQTPIKALVPYLHLVRHVCLLTLAVPGRQGEHFEMDSIEKIQQFHAKYPGYEIEVDGGINPETLPQVVRAGATRAVIGSALFSFGKTPQQRYQELLASAETAVNEAR
jgi:ribulose-phosphate 3-epimerase